MRNGCPVQAHGRRSRGRSFPALGFIVLVGAVVLGVVADGTHHTDRGRLATVVAPGPAASTAPAPSPVADGYTCYPLLQGC